MGVDEVVVAEAHEEVGLAHAAVADDQQLDQVVVALLLLHLHQITNSHTHS